MNIGRLLDPKLIKLSMDTHIELAPDAANPDRLVRQNKELILHELVELLQRSNKIVNPSKLLTEFINRERKATTAVGHGIAIPHVRTYQARELVIGVARSADGYEFGAPDGEPVRLFFAMAAPSYDDSLYLRVFKALAESLRFDYFRDKLMQVESEHEIIRAFEGME